MSDYALRHYIFDFENGSRNLPLKMYGRGNREMIETDFEEYKDFLPISKEGLYPYQLYMLYSISKKCNTEILEPIIEIGYKKKFKKEIDFLTEKEFVEPLESDGHYKLTYKGLGEINDPDNRYIKIVNMSHCIINQEVFSLYIKANHTDDSINYYLRYQDELYLKFGFDRVKTLIKDGNCFLAFEELQHLANISIENEKYIRASMYMAIAIKLFITGGYKQRCVADKIESIANFNAEDEELFKDDIMGIMNNIKENVEHSMLIDTMTFYMSNFELPTNIEVLASEESFSNFIEQAL